MASLPRFCPPCVPRRVKAPSGARTTAPAPHGARPRHAKKSPLPLAASASPDGDAPPLTDDIDALVAALAKTTEGIDTKELFKILLPSSQAKVAAGEGKGGAPSGGKGAARAPSASAKRKLGPAELLERLLVSAAPDADAAATGTVRLLQSLDEDDAAFSSYEEDYESDSGGEGSGPGAASTSSADFSSDDAVGPRLRAELGALVLKAFEAAAGATASSFPDAAKAASRGRLTREPLAALLARGGGGEGGGEGGGGDLPRALRDAAAVDDLLLRFGARDGVSGELYLGYAGFLKLLASEVADLRAVLRYAALEAPAAAEAEAGAAGADAAEASPASASAPPSPPAATSSADFTFRPGTVSLIFGGDDVDAACASAGPGALVCVQAGFTWCSPCKKFAPVYAAFASSYERVTFLKFHANSNEATKALFKERLRVPQTPAFALLRDGKLVAPLVLGANAERLAAALSEAAASDIGKERGEDPLENATHFEKQVFMSRLTAGARKV